MPLLDRTRSRPALHYGYVVIAMSSLALTGGFGFSRLIYSLILPSMKVHLGLTYTETGLLATSSQVGYTIFVPVAGFLATRHGCRLVGAASLVGTGLMVLLMGLSTGFAMAIPVQFLVGMASGGAVVAATAVMSAWFVPQKRGLANGLMSIGLGVGFFLVGPLVPYLIATFEPNGWRYAWFSFGALVVIMGIVVGVFMRDRPENKGLVPVGQMSRPEPADVALTGSGLASVYKSRALWHIAILYGVFGFVYINYATFFAAYLQQEVGLEASAVGNAWAISGIGIIVGGVGWGLLSDVIGRKRALVLAFLFLGAAIFLFTIPGIAGFYYLSALLFWTVQPGVPVIMGAAVGDQVGGRLAPAATGLAILFLGAGQAIGPSVGGYLADATHSFQAVFYLSALVAVAGALGLIPLQTVKGKA